MRYLCDSCERRNGVMFKTYTDNHGTERTIRIPYVRCAKRWTRPMVPAYDWCLDYRKVKR